MEYNNFLGAQVSALGMGNMRLPSIGEGRGGKIDIEKAREMVEYAMAHGINYFDTAYVYHAGESESFTGDVLCNYPRDSYHLATKFPGHMMRYEKGKLFAMDDAEKTTPIPPAQIFETQLQRCKVDYFDFYMLHNVNETSYEMYTDEELGIVDYLVEQKKLGRIRRLGFSAHGRTETLEKLMNWRDCFEFAQIQLNYLDWVLQDAKRKYEMLTQRNIPIIVMEPVRGGALTTITPQGDAMLKAARSTASIVSWAFAFLQGLPNIKVILSGMSSMEQLQENITLFDDPKPTTQEEDELLLQAVATMADLVPCTGCRYCCDTCPAELDIPKLITMYNETISSPHFSLNFALNAMKPEELPSACIACGLCTTLCPQGIEIPEVLAQYAQRLAVK